MFLAGHFLLVVSAGFAKIKPEGSPSVKFRQNVHGPVEIRDSR